MIFQTDQSEPKSNGNKEVIPYCPKWKLEPYHQMQFSVIPRTPFF